MSASVSYTRDQIRAVIAESRLSVHFQPIVDLHDGLVVAYEALTRVPPGSGVSDLAALFQSAEQLGLIWDLEAITRSNAIRTAADWPRGTKLFLNCTPSVFADARFLDALLNELNATPDLSPDCLVLEITELSEDQDINELAEQVHRVVGAGFQVALDDTGAGSSGLNRMMMLRPQWVKLDKQFVRDIDRDTLRQNLVRFFVHYARMSGVQVLAEGIESATELEAVTSLGVRFAQGYYLGKPGPREQTTDPAFIAGMRSRWAAVEACLPPETVEPTLTAVCRAATACAAQTPVHTGLAMLHATPEASGLIVTEGGKVVGWCPRSEFPRLVVEGDDQRISEVMWRDIMTFAGERRVHEVIGEVARSEGERLPDPLIVTSEGRPVGVVRLRDLLRIASAEQQLAFFGRASITGLPGRGKADQHVAEQIVQWMSGRGGVRNLHADAVYLDLRSFTEFTGRLGRSNSERLVLEIAEMISALVVAHVRDVFVAHLGEDRFFLTAPAEQLLPRVRTLLQVYDNWRETVDSEARPPAVRALCLTNALATVQHCRDVYRLEQQVREEARRSETSTSPTGSSSKVTCHEATAESLRRLAA